MIDKLQKYFIAFITQVQILFKEVLLKNKQEYLLFLFLILIYFSYSSILVFNTSIVRFGWVDNYFAFDNPAIYNRGFENEESHPFFYFIAKPISGLGSFLAFYWGENIKLLIWLSVTITLISLSVVYINRYLREIIRLSKFPVFLLTLFYAFFSTNLILCFTPETFTFSLFFLTLIFLSYSRIIKKKRQVNISTGFFYAFVLGSITITNTVKGLIPVLFSNENWKCRIKKFTVLAVILSFIFFIRLYLLSTDWGNGIDAILTRQQLFSGLSGTVTHSFYEFVIDIFLGSVIFLPDLIVVSQEYGDILLNSSMIDLDCYHYWWQYLFLILLYGFIFISIIINRKNRLVQILILFFCFELFLHVVLKYGILNGYIYGGHWVYIIPLLLGWLYKVIDKKYICYFKVILLVLCLSLLTNNILKLIDFIALSQKYYSVVSG